MTATTADERSLAELLAEGDPEASEQFLAGLTDREAELLLTDWEFNARPKQTMPGTASHRCTDPRCGTHAADDWTTWALIAGRGFGKTWVGAQTTRRIAESGEIGIIHLIAPTPADYRDVMIEGPAGLQAISPKWSRPEWFPSKRLVLWPNGVRALCFSAEDPEALRGPQCGFLWGDEPGAWTYGEATWDMAQLGLRMGRRPRQVITTTPKPYKWLKKILKATDTHVTRGTTYENLQNLAEAFARAILSKYEGTRLGRQELMAELLEAVEGALWTPESLELTRRHTAPHDGWQRIVVAVDPAVSATPDSDETGIVVAGRSGDGDVYVLEDCTPGRVSPTAWGKAALAAYHRYKADVIVAEVNNGGDMVVETITNLDPHANVEKITASRGKFVRAEPVSALFEQTAGGRAHMLGMFPLLEEQLTTWIPHEKGQDSPDRLDAMVYALTELTQGRRARLIA